MDVQLYINDAIIDIDSSTIAPLTYAIADVKTPNKRVRNRSKTITIKGTQNNLKILFPAYNLALTSADGSYDFNPNEELTTKIVRNGVDIFVGVANYLKATLSNGVYSFDFQIFGTSVGLFDKLGDRTLAELDWSEYDHALTVANIELSWDTSVEVNGTPTSNFTAGKPDGFGYIYGLINFGYAANQLSPKTIDLIPYFYMVEAFKKCFSVGGYTIAGNWIDEEITKRVVFGISGGERIGLTSLQVQNRLVHYTLNTSSEQYAFYPYSSVQVGYIPGEPIMLHKYFMSVPRTFGAGLIGTTLVDDDSSQFSTTLQTITIAETGNYNLSGSLILTVNLSYLAGGSPITSSSLTGMVVMQCLRNGAIISSNQFSISQGIGIAVTVSLNLQSQLLAGDEVQFRMINVVEPSSFANVQGSGVPVCVYQWGLSNTSFFKVDAIDETLTEGDIVNVSRWMPNMKCRDFVKDIITMYNLYLSEPNDDNEVRIEKFGDYYTDTTDTDNWTLKLDLSKEVEIMPNAGIEGKTYKFKWAEDRDSYKKYYFDRWGSDYGDLDYNVPSTFKKGDKIYQVGFAQTVPIDVDGLTIPQIISRNETTNLPSPHKGKPRIFLYNGLQTGSWDLKNSTTGVATAQTDYPQFHHIDNLTTPTFDLNWGVPIEIYYNATAYTTINLFSENYDVFIKELTSPDSKMLRAYFKINELDLTGNFMGRLVNINGVIYRKNIIHDFDSTGYETTKVELVKVLEANGRKALTVVPVNLEVARISNTPKNENQIITSSMTWDNSMGNVMVLATNSVAINLTLPVIADEGSEVTAVRVGSNTATVLQQGDVKISDKNSIVLSSNWDSQTFIYGNGVWALKYKSDSYYKTVTSNTTLGINDSIVFCDTSGGSFILTLPSDPVDKTRIIIKDDSQSFNINPLTINPNGQNLEGRADNLLINVSKASYELYYKGTGTNQEWKIL